MAKSYEKLKQDVQKLIGGSIQSHSIIDQIMFAIGKSIDAVKEEIEKMKNPHIYSGLKGSNLDELGLLVGCPRFENESDESYFARVMNHHTSNQASNLTSLTHAITNLKYTSHATYVPYTLGVATSTIHFIPKDYAFVEEAKKEIEDRIRKVKAPDSFILIEPAKKIKVNVAVYVIMETETEIIKNQLNEQIKGYVNNIPIGEALSFAKLNAIGLNTKGVKYFNTISIILNDKTMHTLEAVQTIQSKFVLDTIHFELAKQ